MMRKGAKEYTDTVVTHFDVIWHKLSCMSFTYDVRDE